MIQEILVVVILLTQELQLYPDRWKL